MCGRDAVDGPGIGEEKASKARYCSVEDCSVGLGELAEEVSKPMEPKLESDSEVDVECAERSARVGVGTAATGKRQDEMDCVTFGESSPERMPSIL